MAGIIAHGSRRFRCATMAVTAMNIEIYVGIVQFIVLLLSLYQGSFQETIPERGQTERLVYPWNGLQVIGFFASHFWG